MHDCKFMLMQLIFHRSSLNEFLTDIGISYQKVKSVNQSINSMQYWFCTVLAYIFWEVLRASK